MAVTTITWLQLINLCLKDSGVLGTGQVPSGQMQIDARDRLNMMLDEWREDELAIYRLLDLAYACDGSQSYTVGPGAQFPSDVRPAQIEGAYMRQPASGGSQAVDFPMAPIFSQEDYSRIALKSLQAAPSYAFWYNPAYPVGEIFPWPLAAAPYELHILLRELLDEAITLTDNVILPPNYRRAIYANLCVDLGSAFRIDPKPMMIRRAAASLRKIRRNNARVQTLGMPRSLGRAGRYNIISDRGA